MKASKITQNCITLWEKQRFFFHGESFNLRFFLYHPEKTSQVSNTPNQSLYNILSAFRSHFEYNDYSTHYILKRSRAQFRAPNRKTYLRTGISIFKMLKLSYDRSIGRRVLVTLGFGRLKN